MKKLNQLIAAYNDKKRILTSLRSSELPGWQFDFENIQNQLCDVRDQIIKIDPTFFDKIRQERAEKIQKEKNTEKLAIDQCALKIKEKIIDTFLLDLEILKNEIVGLKTMTKVNEKIGEMKLKIKIKFPKVGLQFAKNGEFLGVILL